LSPAQKNSFELFQQATGSAIRALAGPGEPTGPAAPGGMPDAGAPIQIVITGRALPRDALGNRYETDASGNQVVHLAGGGLLALGAAAAVPLPPAGGLVVPGMAALQRLAAAAGTVSNLASGVGMLFALPGNAMDRGESIAVNDNTRFERRTGEVWGRVYDKLPGGGWVVRDEGYTGYGSGAGFVVLSEDEVARLRAPITTPSLPQGPSSPPALPVWVDRPQATPGFQVGPPTPATPGREAATQPTAQELLIQKAKDSKALGDNMEAAGMYAPGPGYERHHIVPTTAGDARMDAVRAKLKALGLDLNDAANGVWLPGHRADPNAPEAYHPRLNNDVYNDTVANALKDLTNLQAAIRVLADIRSQLQANDFPGVRPRPEQGARK
jgi:hypothetical protein